MEAPIGGHSPIASSRAAACDGATAAHRNRHVCPPDLPWAIA
jgi:hypothetical protein